MIRLGLTDLQKQTEIVAYAATKGIKKVFLFYPKAFPLEASWSTPTKKVEYNDIIMYKTFYPLLEEINDTSLLVFNECLRTRKRSDLTYNCAHHYCGQTPHKIVFERLPFIGESFYFGRENYGMSDFMILLDFIDKGRFKGKSFEWRMLEEVDVKAVPVHFTYDSIDLELGTEVRGKYNEKRESLFENLGNKEVETIPRALHIFAGDYKKPFIRAEKEYVARNSRFKLSNVKTYRDVSVGKYTIIDFAHRRLDFNDFLKRTMMTNIQFLNSKLPIDNIYESNLRTWIESLEEFYAKASLYSD